MRILGEKGRREFQGQLTAPEGVLAGRPRYFPEDWIPARKQCLIWGLQDQDVSRALEQLLPVSSAGDALNRRLEDAGGATG
jgi:hypothetical protein